jgi:regulator of sigma E protease
MSWYWYVVGALGLALLMVVHESGHFFVARAFGMRVTRFSIGFGPTFFKIVPEDGYYWFTAAADRIRLRLWKHDPERQGPTVYQVAMIPFLAYVQIAGMNPLEDVDGDDQGSYANASVVGRIATIFAGPLANYLFASVLFFGSFFFGGREVRGTEVSVLENRPAAAASIKTGDRIVEINGVAVQEWDQMAEIISQHPDDAIPVVVERAGQRIPLQVTPVGDHGKGKIGVASIGPIHKIPMTAKEASLRALTAPALVVKEQVVGLSQFITGKAEGELSGPAGMVKATAMAAQLGWTRLLYFLGMLSALLGAFNLVPFPALDGGRLMFLGYEATTRRRANARIEANIHVIGFAMMIGLVLYVTVVNDLRLTGRPPLDSERAAPAAAPALPAPTGAPTSTPAPQGGK